LRVQKRANHTGKEAQHQGTSTKHNSISVATNIHLHYTIAERTAADFFFRNAGEKKVRNVNFATFARYCDVMNGSNKSNASNGINGHKAELDHCGGDGGDQEVENGVEEEEGGERPRKSSFKVGLTLGQPPSCKVHYERSRAPPLATEKNSCVPALKKIDQGPFPLGRFCAIPNDRGAISHSSGQHNGSGRNSVCVCGGGGGVRLRRKSGAYSP
jgi:hypothetical protein